MTSARKLSLLATCIYLASSGNPVFAACDSHLPINGQTVQCDLNTPNPDSFPIVSANGITGVTVNIAHNSGLNVNGAEAISLGDASNITNAGQISGTTGILLREGSSLLDNSGSITGTTGTGVLFTGGGSNQLTNSGTIAGGAGNSAVIFGSGNDSLTVTGGTITGNVELGDGVDKTNISSGTITGTLSQGNGIDDFIMSGGTLGALFQGDNRDNFTMTGGTITGAFEDGDVAKMTGGKIGRVDMKLDNNIFDMSGGEIVGNLVTGFGNDTIIITNDSLIGGNVSVSGGTDSVTVTGGTIKGEVRMSAGNDLFHWEKGDIQGGILMGNDDDRIEFSNLDLVSAATSPLIDGGDGDDTLVMDNSQYVYSNANVLQGLEHIDLANGSTLTLDNRILALGDAADDNSNTGFAIDSTSTLAMVNTNATALNSHLSGRGTVSTNTEGNAFNFTSNNADDNFEGILALGNSTFDLSGQNTQALTQATLRAEAESITTVGAGTQRIGAFSFDGGTVDFGSVAPGNTLAENTIQTRRDLDLNGTGTVKLGIKAMINKYPVAINNLPLLSQDDEKTNIKLAGSNGTVSGSAGSLALIDDKGNVITDGITDDIIQDGSIVAQGTWDWRLTTGENHDGLYVGYALKQVDLLGIGEDALLLNSAGATGNAADLSAKITGIGDLAIGNTANGTVSLSNQDNDYTGITDVRSGNLLMNNDHVLGNTSLLQLAPYTTLDMNGYTQTIGRVTTAESSQLNINDGSLTIDQGGTINGRLLGAGVLTLNNGALDVYGANTSLTANSRILNGASINLNNASGLGSGNIDNAGELNLNSANGSLQNNLSNRGTVNLDASQIVLEGNNSPFSGIFNIGKDSQLTASEAKHLGSSSIDDAGTLKLFTNTDWSLNNSLTGEGDLIKEGSGVVTLTQSSSQYNGETDINEGGIIFGSRSQPLTLATSLVNINQGFLAGNGIVVGDVNNLSLLQVGSNDSSSFISPTPSINTLSAGNDALVIEGNLTNSGQIQLGQTGSNIQAGNALTVDGNYIGNNGRIAFNTALEDDNSATDILTIQGNTAGTTYVSVENAGGNGARTLNGIELIDVAGSSDGQFIQDGRIVAGAYDYRLARGGGSNQSNWYLTNEVNDPGVPTTPSSSEVMVRPEAGSYIENLAAANTMFTTHLHDRLGETQYTDILTGEKQVTSLWLRQVGTHNSWRSNVGSLKTTSNQYVVMLGGDVAQWSDNGLDRGHLGLMAGYGNNHNNTHSGLTHYSSKGKVEGYNAGLYGTWYANDVDKTGLYLDSWAQYSWFKNTVNGENIAEEKYDSKGLSASLESGYTWEAGKFYSSKQSLNSVYIQPQAQITWMGVKADDHTENNGTHVSSDGDGNIQTRLGTRIFIKGHSKLDEGKNREFEPFAEVNWLHNTRSFSTKFNDVRINQDGARNIAEVKAGVEGQLSRNITAWGNVGQQIGDESYYNTEAMLGVKYSW